MTITFQTTRLAWLWTVGLLFLTGCHHEQAVLLNVGVEIPKQFTVDGTVWKNKQMEAKQEAVLTQFFAANQELMDSPEYEGYPSVFTSAKNTYRFYWLKPSIDGLEWRCIEIDGRVSNLLEGNGNPFE